jgi:ABC-type transporter MlaC component
MKIWKNKKTGKAFIYIEDAGLDEALFVTPLAEIKSLKKSIFEEEPTEEKDAVTESQEKVYQEYKERRRQDAEKRRQDAEKERQEVLDTACLQLFGRKFSELTDQDKEELFKKLKKAAKRMAKTKRHSEEDKP